MIAGQRSESCSMAARLSRTASRCSRAPRHASPVTAGIAAALPGGLPSPSPARDVGTHTWRTGRCQGRAQATPMVQGSRGDASSIQHLSSRVLGSGNARVMPATRNAEVRQWQAAGARDCTRGGQPVAGAEPIVCVGDGFRAVASGRADARRVAGTRPPGWSPGARRARSPGSCAPGADESPPACPSAGPSPQPFPAGR